MLILFTAIAPIFAAELKDLKLKTVTNKPNSIEYKVNEPITFMFHLDGMKELPADVTAPLYVIWTRMGDDGVTEKGTNVISLAKGFDITTRLGVPGIVRCEAELVDANYKCFDQAVNPHEKGVKCHAGAGAETEKMTLSTKEPEDFDAFWAIAKQQLATVPVKAKLVDVTPAKQKQVKIYAIEIDCYGPRPATGWFTVPVNAQAKSLKAIASFHGYNGNNFNVPKPPTGGRTDALTLDINAHGYAMVGHDLAYYKDYGNKVNGVVPGAAARNCYALEPSDYTNAKDTYFYYMAMRVMRAFDYLKSRPEWNGKDLEAQGGSQGGLQTMWAAGLVDGLSAARPSITWGCNIGNWGVPDSKLLTRNWGIPNVPGAFYFDSALHAKRVPKTCQVEITRLGLGDYTCPPRGILLSYYLMKCPVKAQLYQGSTHGYVPPQPNQVFTISK